MNSIDDSDRRQMIIKYGKYFFILIIIIVVLLILKSCKHGYNSIESEMITAAKKYISDNNVAVYDQLYVELTDLGEIEGTELCSKASGVIVKNENGTLKYKPYLSCDNYQTELSDSKHKYIKLEGDDVLILNKGEVYEEKAYTLTGDADVVISGKVGTIPGTYTVTYDVYVDNELKETAERTVIVSANDKDENITKLENRVDPVITLKGDTEIVLKVGQKYVEEGYTAVDYTDGKISRNVVINNEVNERKVGNYQIRYSVTNSKGNTAIAIRNVTVVKYKADFEIIITKSTEEITKSLELKIQAKGSGYGKMFSPCETSGPTCSKTINSNGKYKVVAEDKYGNKVIKEIEISNIDDVPPEGMCTALVRGSNTEIEVNANDNKGIAGYSYILDSKATEFMSFNTYKVSESSKTVSVKIKDIAGNQKTIKCDTTIKEETTVQGRPSGSIEVIDTSEYRLVSTKNDTIEFAKIVDSLNVAQDHPPGYPDYCLSFAYYHSYNLYNGTNLTSMTAAAASEYKYATKFQAFNNDNKQVVLAKLYELINAGQPVILHVNGNKAGTSRHYVTVVGYKNSVTSGSTIKETDLLILDSHDGKLERMDRESSRFMISGWDTGRKGDKGYGYQLYILR